MRLVALLLLVAGAAKVDLAEEHEKKLTYSEAHAKPIQIKDFDEGKFINGNTNLGGIIQSIDSKDDRTIHFTMAPDHVCVDGICSDGHFMLTDMPDFYEVCRPFLKLNIHHDHRAIYTPTHTHTRAICRLFILLLDPCSLKKAL